MQISLVGFTFYGNVSSTQFAKNSPPDCFLNAHLRVLLQYLEKTKNRPIWSVLNFGRGRRTQIRFLADLHCLTTQILWISVPVFAPFRYKTVIHTVLFNAQSPLRVRVLYIFTIKRKHPPKWWMFLSMAGAEGLEPSARGFGDRCSTN